MNFLKRKNLPIRFSIVGKIFRNIFRERQNCLRLFRLSDAFHSLRDTQLPNRFKNLTARNATPNHTLHCVSLSSRFKKMRGDGRCSHRPCLAMGHLPCGVLALRSGQADIQYYRAPAQDRAVIPWSSFRQAGPRISQMPHPALVLLQHPVVVVVAIAVA